MKNITSKFIADCVREGAGSNLDLPAFACKMTKNMAVTRTNPCFPLPADGKLPFLMREALREGCGNHAGRRELKERTKEKRARAHAYACTCA